MRGRKINMLMVGGTAVLGAVVLFSLLLQPSYAQDTDRVDWNARAKQTWQDTCQKCHTAPDSVFETDRAYLRQIAETT